VPFRSVSEYAEAIEAGKTWTSWMHKTTSAGTQGVGQWCDASVGSGTPKYNAYVGDALVARQMVGSGNVSIYAGPTPPAGERKRLVEMAASTTNANSFSAILCDYLLFYPFIDGDDGGDQALDNTVKLPRYEDGLGVRAMLLCQTPMVTNGVARLGYTNHAGDSKVSPLFAVGSTAAIGSVVHRMTTTVQANRASPFIEMAAGDLGIRSVESITLTTQTGGLLTLVLVRPLASILMREAATWTERPRFLTAGGVVPRIFDDSFLNYIFTGSASASWATMRGALTFAWG
jgi:hypothetical protein